MNYCTIENCNNTAIAKSICRKHYNQSYQRTYISRYSSIHSSYWNMRSRCLNPNTKQYMDYGGRGIKICDRWLSVDGLENFTNDMGEKPTPQHTLDRIDPNGNYEPENCRWATYHQQGANKRNSRPVIGVYYYPYLSQKRPWIACLKVNKVVVLYEYFSTETEAITARKEAERKHLQK